MTSAFTFYYRDDFVEDLDALIDLDLPNSNMSVATDITTDSVMATDITTEGLIGSNMWSSNIYSEIIVADDILTCGLVGRDLVASNTVGSNVFAEFVVGACNLVADNSVEGMSLKAGSNLYWGGHSLYDPCPQDPSDWDDLIPFSGDTEGFIHASWIRKPLTAKDVLTDLWNVADAGFDIAETILDAYNFFQGTGQEALAQGAIDSLNTLLDNALEGGEAGSNPKLLVHWNNLKSVPIANNTNDIGIKGDLFVNDAKALKVLGANRFSIDEYGNLKMTTTSPETILNFGSREAFLKAFFIGSNTYTSDSNKSFAIHDWLFSSNVISNRNSPVSSVQFSTSNNNIAIAGKTHFLDNIKAETLINCDRFVSSINGETLFSSNTSNLKIRFQDGTGSTSKKSYIYQFNDTLEYKTQDSEANYGGVAPQILQMSIDSNGTMFIRSSLSCSNITTNKITTPSHGTIQFTPSNIAISFSNINSSTLYQNTDAIEYWTTSNSLSPVKQFSISSNGEAYVRSNVVMPFTATIRAVTAEQEGIMRMTSNTFRFLTSNNTREDIWFSVNSNGMFLPNKSSIYSKNETFEMPNYVNPLEPFSFTNFARFDLGLSNGFTWGWNISNDVFTDSNYDLFNVSRFAEVKTLDKRTNLMTTVINSNAQMVAEINTTIASSISNLTCFNVNACNLMENNQSLSSRYAGSNALSNVNSNLTGFSNWVSPMSVWSSNNTSNLTAFSNWVSPMSLRSSNNTSNLTAFSNWVSPMSVWSSNNTSNLTSFSNIITPMTIWNSNSLSNFTTSNTGSWGSNTSSWLSNNNRWFLLSNINQTSDRVLLIADGGQISLNQGHKQFPFTILTNSMNTSPFDTMGAIAFSQTTTSNCSAGAFISFQATSSNSVGNLHFHTKKIGTPEANCDRRMTITSSGFVGVGTSNPVAMLEVAGDLAVTNRSTTLYIQPGRLQNADTANVVQYEMGGVGLHYFWDNLQASGSITGASKHFIIENPLDSKKVLIHTCIESSRADLHYSGRVKLDKGKARVVIDVESCENSPMTIGTFEKLTRNPRVYLQNNSSFSRVKGRVVGGDLIIECEDKSNDEIDWIVIAERNDTDFKKSKMANSKGRLITEGLKKDWVLNEKDRPSKQKEKREK